MMAADERANPHAPSISQLAQEPEALERFTREANPAQKVEMNAIRHTYNERKAGVKSRGIPTSAYSTRNYRR